MSRLLILLLTVGFCLPLPVQAGAVRGVDPMIGRSGDDAVLVLSGTSSDSCLPGHPSVELDGRNLLLVIPPSPSQGGCGFAITGWRGIARLPNPEAGTYNVTVRHETRLVTEFSFDWPQVKSPRDDAFTPSEGIWWSSDNSGTGLSFNIDDQGRWFAALYLYENDGRPSFLTLQGESLSYRLDAGLGRPYALAASALIESEGGQCLGCFWSPASAMATGDDAVLLFFNRSSARLIVGGWSLELAPLTVPGDDAFREQALPLHDRHYLMIADGKPGRHVSVVRSVRTGPDPSQPLTARLQCVDCRSVDDEGNGSDIVDSEIRQWIQDDIHYSCAFPDMCRLHIDDAVGRSYVDKTGTAISAVAKIPGSPDTPTTRIELRLLPEPWREH